LIMNEKPTNPKDQIAVTKLPLHLVSPLVEAYQAIAHYLGNVKYGAWNYRGAGIRYSVYYAALKRHMGAWWEGEEYDPVDGTPHLANALACINIIIEGKHAHNAVDDRPPSQGEELAKIRAEFEQIAARIKERYADKDPYHVTIADTGVLRNSGCGEVGGGSGETDGEANPTGTPTPSGGDNPPVHAEAPDDRQPTSRPEETTYRWYSHGVQGTTERFMWSNRL
jgi:hypothetical protein